MEAHKKAQTIFSLNCFELFVTITVIATNQSVFDDKGESRAYLSYFFMLCYNIITCLNCFELFVSKVCKWPTRLSTRLIALLRFACLAVAVGLELSLQRRASMWGCWVIASIFYYIVLEIFANRHLLATLTRHFKKKLKKEEKEVSNISIEVVNLD